ncbi:NTPase [Operophtera brumata]|uniref:NTPase n=1 Tax=Operophtera brumata TaxID=104452 RepID=A0A0L7KW14_OPEBR|nr:NTPase [Operophtera brumata]
MATLDWEPSEPPKGTVAAMSYFYDVAADAGIIDAGIIGELTIRDGHSGLGAKRAAQRDSRRHELLLRCGGRRWNYR